MELGGVETIVGTTSYGNATCTDGGYDARVDVNPTSSSRSWRRRL